MGITFHIDTAGLIPWQANLNAKVGLATYRAGTDASRRMKAEGSRFIRQQKNIKVAKVNQAIRIVGPRSPKDVHVWRVMAGIVAQPVFAFGPRPTKKGVSVTINRGARVSIPHAFVATMRSGHTGVFVRYGQATRAPTSRWKGKDRYKGQKRQPIRELWTTRISDAFTDAIPAMAERGRSEFIKAFTRNMRIPNGSGA